MLNNSLKNDIHCLPFLLRVRLFHENVNGSSKSSFRLDKKKSLQRLLSQVKRNGSFEVLNDIYDTTTSAVNYKKKSFNERFSAK